LQVWTRTSVSPVIIESDLAQGGTELSTAVPRNAKETDWAGVFELRTTGKEIKLRLSQEACSREVHTPRRSSQYVATLQPWEPIRLILNGKADWPSGRLYYLQDYHVVLCGADSCPENLPPVRTFDFQADLI
jgi:hypothetical protein